LPISPSPALWQSINLILIGSGPRGSAPAQRSEIKVEATVATKGIRAFTTTPYYVFTSLDQALAYVGTPPNKAPYFLVRLAPDADVESVRSRLRTILSDSEVLTPSGDISAMRVRAELDERDFDGIKIGQTVWCARPPFASVNSGRSSRSPQSSNQSHQFT
jgi:hypothetical protein